MPFFLARSMETIDIIHMRMTCSKRIMAKSRSYLHHHWLVGPPPSFTRRGYREEATNSTMEERNEGDHLNSAYLHRIPTQALD
jgi:hypothetical protein